MKVSYNITQNKFNASLNQETTEIKVSFKTGYYPFPSDLDLSNYYTKSETYSKVEVDEIISEIPVVDTSNLVPYSGATQNVNIGEYYFESSQGFKKTGGTANQALTANGAVYDLTTKADLVDGKVPSSQLPSYVDDVLEFANLASFPATGESGKIYIAIDTNITYRWSGTGYAEISASLALGETSSTAYRGDRGKIAYDHSQTTGNPHGTTKADIGLDNVDNTSDLDKPISTATQNALNGKQNVLTNPITGTGANGQVAFFNGTTTQTGDNGLFWDNTNKRLGIGSSATPQARLDVRAQGALSTDIAFRVRNSADTANLLSLNELGVTTINAVNENVQLRLTNTGAVNNRSAIAFQFNNSGVDQAMIRALSGIIVGQYGRFAISTHNVSRGGMVDRMLFDEFGGVSIGASYAHNVAIPARLDVRAQGALSTDIAFRVRNSADTINLIQVNGDGTLNITSDGTNSFAFDYAGGSSIRINGDRVVQKSGDSTVFGGTQNSLSLRTNSVNRLTIDINGLVSINGSVITSAQLSVDSTTRGFLPPRMTTTQRDAIVSPAAGLVIYNTTTNTLDRFNGTSWNAFESVDNKVTDLNTPNNTTYPTTQAVVNENKKATITVELIDLLTTNFYAPNALRINSTALISGSGTITLKVNDVAYTLGNLITQGAKITVETTTASVYNLIGIYE